MQRNRQDILFYYGFKCSTQQAFDLLLDILKQNPINVTFAKTMQGSQERITATAIILFSWWLHFMYHILFKSLQRIYKRLQIDPQYAILEKIYRHITTNKYRKISVGIQRVSSSSSNQSLSVHSHPPWEKSRKEGGYAQAITKVWVLKVKLLSNISE